MPSSRTFISAGGHAAVGELPPQATILMSWKEIASYLGKGVRTVQRWEYELDLPVRRPDKSAKGVVCALSEELDCWLNSRWSNGQAPSRNRMAELESENNVLRKSMSELQAENERLRCELDVTWRGMPVQASNDYPGQGVPNVLLAKCSQLWRTSRLLRERQARIVEESRNLLLLLRPLELQRVVRPARLSGNRISVWSQ